MNVPSVDLAWLASYPALTVAANIAGVISFILGFIFFYRSKERFTLRYHIIEKAIIERQLERRPFDLDGPISWHGAEVNNRLVRSFVYIQNAGNKLIEKNDLVGAPFLQTGKGAKILDALIVHCDDGGSQPQLIGMADDAAHFDFEFLRPSEGLIFKVDHTGRLNELFVKCRTKRGGPIKKYGSSFGFFTILLFIILFGLAAKFIFPMLDPQVFGSFDEQTGLFAYFFYFFVGCVLLFFAAIMFVVTYFVYAITIRRFRPPTSSEVFVLISANLRGAV